MVTNHLLFHFGCHGSPTGKILNRMLLGKSGFKKMAKCARGDGNESKNKSGRVRQLCMEYMITEVAWTL